MSIFWSKLFPNGEYQRTPFGIKFLAAYVVKPRVYAVHMDPDCFDKFSLWEVIANIFHGQP